VSNFNDDPGPPPDDFSKTTPNINLPSDDSGPTDWDKTNYNYPKQPVADDWGKTVTNIKPIDTDQQDFGKTMHPGARNVPDADWGVTRADIDVSGADFGTSPDDFGSANDKTTPYFKLPEAERAKYQNLPPTPAEQAAQAEQEAAENRGIPTWVWIGAGLTFVFFVALIVLAAILYAVTRPTSFEATVKSVPPGSDVRVDDKSWGFTENDSMRLVNLEAGERTITIVNDTQECEPRKIEGKGGDRIEIIARCKPMPVKAGEDCTKIRLGEEDKAERCYNKALDDLPDAFTAEALTKALNILIVNFDSNKYDIPAKRLTALKRAAEYIKKLPPEVVLEVGGHTDNRGSDPTNQTLSDNRANAVKRVLVEYGVRGEVLQTRGYGASRPKPDADNNTEEGRFHNRRIEYSVVKK
jgi:outer membrane protein OmpA-like peptidoglycan-associated protein